jgi:hypothetical protein
MYIVVFASYPGEAYPRVNASRHRFEKLKDAREYAAPFVNAYIFRREYDEPDTLLKTRAEIRRKQ